MTAAALATGNAVVLKPAEQSPGVRACGSSRRCGPGASRRRRSRCSPARATSARRSSATRDVQTIAFTGSLPVGLEIIRAGGRGRARPARDQARGRRARRQELRDRRRRRRPRRGGPRRSSSSAFAYAGQKCSAASRVLVHEAIADQLIERVAGAARVLVVGQADGARNRGAAGDRARGAGAGRALRRARRARRGGSSPGPSRCRTRGWFCPPTVAADLPPDSRGARGGDLRAAADDRARPRRRARVRHRRRPSVRAHRRAVRARSRRPSGTSAIAPRSATCTSTAGSPARRSAASRSAATACRERAPRPAVPDYLLQLRRAPGRDREHHAPRAGRVAGADAAVSCRASML